MAVSLSELYETLKEPLGEQGARMVMDFFQIDTYQLLVPVIGKKAAQKLVDFVTEIAR